MRLHGALAALIAQLALPPALARGDRARPAHPGTSAPRPWAENVSRERQRAALALFQEGNDLFVRGKYAEALALYVNALEHWDHPSIRFNASQALVQLDRPVEAYEHGVRALVYGAAPLGEETFQRASLHVKMLEKQLARLVVTSDDDGAVVSLDGTRLFVAPGRAERIVLPGQHQVVAKRPGRLSHIQDVLLLPGEPTVIEMRTAELPAPVLTRRWAPWKPWLVVGTGSVAALAGLGLKLQASAHMRQFDEEVARFCRTGCTDGDIPASTAELRTRARIEDVTGLTLIGAGAAAVIAGAVLVFLNQPRPLADEGAPAAAIAPLVSRTFAGAELTLEF